MYSDHFYGERIKTETFEMYSKQRKVCDLTPKKILATYSWLHFYNLGV